MRRRRRRSVYAGRGGVRRDVKSILFGGARRRHFAPVWAALAMVAGGTGAAVAMADEPQQGPPSSEAQPAPAPPPVTPLEPWPEVRYRESRAVGMHYAGRLVRGVKLPFEGEHFFTWDPVLRAARNRGWRRHGTDDLVRILLRVVAEFRAENPGAPRVGIGDLSRPRGGEFGARFGGLGHASHQNGLDADVYYPRLDRAERRAWKPSQVDRALAQDLVDRFVDAGAIRVFVGPRLGLTGPRRVVAPLVHHDDHLHVRFSAE